MGAKWKDYVDLYFIAKKYDGLRQVADRGREMFGEEFNEKIFRVQLSYFEDIDYSEAVEYVEGFRISDETVRDQLIRFSVS